MVEFISYIDPVADPGEGESRGAKESPFSAASLVHRVEAAVAHCVVKYCGCCKMCSGRRASLTLGVSVARR